MGLLLGADEQSALRELEQIADYRNYHRYEIYKEVEGKPPVALSEYGTGAAKGQVDPQRTGCPYADEVLLPAIRERGQLDQELPLGPGRAGD